MRRFSRLLLTGALVASAGQAWAQTTAPTAKNPVNSTSNLGGSILVVTKEAAPEASFLERLRSSTTLLGYMSYIGPTVAGPIDQTYNVFRTVNKKNDAPSPQQMYLSGNLRFNINTNWSVGATLAATVDTTKRAKTGKYYYYGNTVAENHWETLYNKPERTWYNARAYVTLPMLDLNKALLFNTISWEFPTSNDSKRDEMRYGIVLSQTLALRLPWPKITAGLNTQFIRYRYGRSVDPPPFPGGSPSPFQTTFVFINPYMNYALADTWQLAGQVMFDWDQKGHQTDTLQFNNNLPDRVRLGVNHYFTSGHFKHVGVFMQGLTEPRSDRTLIGADMSVLF